MTDLKSLAGRNIGGGRYPTKTSINLLYKEKNTGHQIFVLCMFGIFLVFLAAFTKYLVIDQLARVGEAESRYTQLEEQLAKMEQSTSSYDEVEEQYNHYGSGYLTAEEAARQDRAAMLQVIDSKITVDSGIRSISISENTAVVTVDGVNMNQVADMVSSLEESDIVSYVNVSTAETGDGSTSVVRSDGSVVQAEAGNDGTVTADLTITFRSSSGASADSGQDSQSLTDQLAQSKEAAESTGENNG
jgi:Tfp pilus assembly protein PilN